MTNVTEGRPEAHFSASVYSPDTFVLETRVEPDQLPGSPRLGDDHWDLSAIKRMQHENPVSLNFLNLPEAFRLPAKEFFAGLLLGATEVNRKRPQPATFSGYFTALKRFLTFLDARGTHTLAAVDKHLLAEYFGFIDKRRKNRHMSLLVVELLYETRAYSSDPLALDPSKCSFWVKPIVRKGENKTPRIPERVLEPTLKWAALFVEVLAPDIFAARQEFLTLLNHRPTDTTRRPGHITAQRRKVEAVLDWYEATGTPLPTHTVTKGRIRAGRPNWFFLDRQAGVNSGITCRTLQRRVMELGNRNGFDAGTLLTTRPTALIGDTLWMDRFSYYDIARLIQNLQISAYMIVAFFSGMRDSEVKHLQRGCLIEDTDRSGALVRRRLRSKAFKGNDVQHGKDETWVVCDIVHKAIQVLEELQDDDETYLFHHLREGTSHHGRTTLPAQSTGVTNTAMEEFATWVNSFHEKTKLGMPIPNVDGNAWRITTRQFRRTLAWFIARRPGGIAAGALQYKHLSLQIFRGYGGTSDSGFAEELATEQALARGEWLGEFEADVENSIGRATEEAARRLQARGASIRFAGKLPENERQLVQLLQKFDPHVYRGSMVTCVFDPKKALCLRKTGDDPNLGQCQPLKCGNAIFTQDDVAAWRQRADDLMNVARDPSFAPAVRHRAADHANRLHTFFDSLLQRTQKRVIA